MQEQLRAIDDLLLKREIKKAEVLIARCLRATLPAEERAQVLLSRAHARLLGARPDDALDDLRQVRSLAALMFEEPEVLQLLGDGHFARFELASVGFADRQDAVQAEATYRQILEHFPDYENLGWVYYQLGRVLLTDDRAVEAVSCFQQALLSPSYQSALTAYCYERLGFVAFYEQRDLKQALGFLNKALDTYPPTEDRLWLVQLHILRSRALRGMQRYELALKAAETALAVASVNSSDNKMGLTEALLTIGELLSEAGGREKEVISCLQQFLQFSKKPLGVDVTWSRVHEMLGDAYFKTGQHSTAVNAYQSALQYNPYHPWELSLYYRMARSFYQQGEYEKSVQAIHRMLEAARADGQVVSDYRVYDVLGNAQFALARYQQAAESYQMAIQIAPASAEELEKIRKYYEYAQGMANKPS